jgi:ABC-2 type transport system permease protein
MTPAQTWRQCAGLFRIYVQDGLAYKAAGVIWIMMDVASAVTMPLVWLAASGGSSIRGFERSDIVLYYLCVLMLSNFVVCHFMWDIAWEVKDGMFSVQLVRPVPYLWFILVRNLAWRCVRSLLFLPFFFLILLCYAGTLHGAHLHLEWPFWASLLLGHLVSVTFVTALAMVALFTEEAQAVFELYYLPMLFLSGQLFPLALLPGWASGLAHLLPFYYTTGAPTEILVGRLSGDRLVPVLLAQAAWIVASVLLFKLLFARGTRRYAGVGM